MHQHLTLKRPPRITIAHHQTRRQPPPIQRHRINQIKLIRPLPPRLGIQPRRRQPKIQLGAQIHHPHPARTLTRALAQKLPSRAAREPVLRQLDARRRRPEEREDERDAAAHGLGAVERRRGREPELFGAGGVFPGGDGCAVEEDGDGLAGGEDGGDEGVVVGEGDGGGGGEAGGGG